METTAEMKKDVLAEAAEWRLLSLLFDCPKEGWFEDVKALGAEVADKDLKHAAVSAADEASEGIFHSTFGPGGPAPGREVSYRSWVEPGQLLSEVSSYYEAFAYRPTTHEVPDHVAVQAGFISYLKLKQFYAEQSGDAENAQTTADAVQHFLAEHMSKYAESLSRHLSGCGYEYLELAGKALFDRVGRDADGRRTIALPVLDDSEDEFFECGTAG